MLKLKNQFFRCFGMLQIAFSGAESFPTPLVTRRAEYLSKSNTVAGDFSLNLEGRLGVASRVKNAF